MTFRTDPLTYPTDPNANARSRFRNLIKRGQNAMTREETVMAAVFGDSKWTSTGGAGILTMPFVLEALGVVFGGIAGSRAISLAQNTQGAPLIESGRGVPVIDSGVDRMLTPPGLINNPNITSIAEIAEGSEYNNATRPVFRGNFTPANVASGRFSMLGTLFPVDRHIIEVTGVRRANCDTEFNLDFRPTALAIQGAAPTVDSDVVRLDGLDQAPAVPGTLELVTATSKAFDCPPATPTPQFQITANGQIDGGTVDTGGTRERPYLAYVRLLNEDPKGIILDSLSAGGHAFSSWHGHADGTAFPSDHENAAHFTAQMRHDLIFVPLGANDIYGGQPMTRIRQNVYNTDAALAHRGVIGEHVAARDALDIERPLFILISPPYRAEFPGEAPADYAAAVAVHEAWTAELISLADEMTADGIDVIVWNNHRFTHTKGFNEQNDNHLVLNDRGDYDTNGVSYAVNDRYRDSNNNFHRCLVAHVSNDGSTQANLSTDPVADFFNGRSVYHAPTSVHLVDQVHFRERGARVVADGISLLAYAHADAPNAELSQSSIEAITSAVADANQSAEIPVLNTVAAGQPIRFNLTPPSTGGFFGGFFTEPATAPTPGNFVVSVPSAVTVGAFSTSHGYEITITPNTATAPGDNISVTGVALGNVVNRQWSVVSNVAADAIAEATEQRLLNEMDGDAFMQLLADRLEEAINNEADGSMTLAGLVALIRSDLERIGGPLEMSANGVGLSAADIDAIAARILASPTNPIATNAAGAVTTSNPTTGGAGVDHTTELTAIAAQITEVDTTMFKKGEIQNGQEVNAAGADVTGSSTRVRVS